MCKYVLDFTDSDNIHALPAKRIKYRFSDRLKSKITPVFRSGVFPVAADERTRNDSSDKVVARQHCPCGLAHFIKLFKRDNVFMRRDLKHAVRRGINDRFSRCNMFVAEFLNYYRAGSNFVSKRSSADFALKFFHQRFREAVRICAERCFHCKSCHLPVSARCVLCLCDLRCPSERGRRRIRARKPRVFNISDSECRKVRNVQRPCRINIAESVSTRIPEFACIGHCSDSDAVQNDYRCTFFHILYLFIIAPNSVRLFLLFRLSARQFMSSV